MKDLSGQSPAEIIQKLIDGELSFTDTQKYSRLANTDPEFKKEFESYSRVKNAIKADKQKQLDNAVPSPTLKANLMKELGMGAKPVELSPLATASRFSEFGTFAYNWLTNLKYSVPSLAVITAFTFFSLMNDNDTVSNKNNNSTNKNNKTTNSKNIPITSASIDSKSDNKTILVDKFDNKSNFNSSKANNNSNIKTISKNKDINSKNINKIQNKQVSESKTNEFKNITNSETSYHAEFNSNIKHVDLSKNNYNSNDKVELNDIVNNNDNLTFYKIEKSNLYTNKLELTNQIEVINTNKNNRTNSINISPISNKSKNIDGNTNLGFTLIFSQITQLNKNEFTIGGFKKLNTATNYNIDGGIEYNRVFLVPISNALTNDGKFDGVGFGARFVSNGLLKEVFGEQIGDMVNLYSGITLGTTTPGLYSKINAGLQFDIININVVNLTFTAGYEYFSLLQNNPNFSTERKGVVSGILIKF